MNEQPPMILKLGDGAFIKVTLKNENLMITQEENEKRFNDALEAVKQQDWDRLYDLIRPVKSYVDKLNGIEIQNGTLYWNEQPVHNAVADRIVQFAMEGINYKFLLRFLEKLMLNPSAKSVRELYNFLEHKCLKITDNGNFLAYKGVTQDYYSVRTGNITLLKGTEKEGRIYNAIGEEIQTERNNVDDDANEGCSFGLHVGTEEYAVSYARSCGGRVVLVEVNPKDVVSVPNDENYKKLRTCAYRVIEDYDMPITDTYYQSNWKEYDDDHDYEDDYDYDDDYYGDDDDDDYEAYEKANYQPDFDQEINNQLEQDNNLDDQGYRYQFYHNAHHDLDI